MLVDDAPVGAALCGVQNQPPRRHVTPAVAALLVAASAVSLALSAELPTLRISGVKSPVVQIVDEASDEIVYTLRIAGRTWRPHVFAPGRSTVRISEPETRRERVVKGVIAARDQAGTLDVRV